MTTSQQHLVPCAEATGLHALGNLGMTALCCYLLAKLALISGVAPLANHMAVGSQLHMAALQPQHVMGQPANLLPGHPSHLPVHSKLPPIWRLRGVRTSLHPITALHNGKELDTCALQYRLARNYGPGLSS